MTTTTIAPLKWKRGTFDREKRNGHTWQYELETVVGFVSSCGFWGVRRADCPVSRVGYFDLVHRPTGAAVRGFAKMRDAKAFASLLSAESDEWSFTDADFMPRSCRVAFRTAREKTTNV